MQERARAGNADSALRLLARTKGLDPLYGSQLRAEIAQALFTQGRDEQALRLAQGALRQSEGRIGLAGYVGGLAAWRLDAAGRGATAVRAASRAEIASTSLRAGAAFWAARAHLRNRDPAGYRPGCGRPRRASTPSTACSPGGSWASAPACQAAATRCGRRHGRADGNAAGPRAFALLQVGQTRRAEAELRCLWPDVSGDAALSGAVLRVAEAAGLLDLAAQLAGLIETAEGRPHDDARFPIPPLRPAGGFRMDPASSTR